MTGTWSSNIPILGEKRGSEEIDVGNALTKLFEAVNAPLNSSNEIDGSKVAAATLPGSKLTDNSIARAKLEVDAKPFKWYTPKIIATEEGIKAESYTKAGTADEITGIVIPENGMLLFHYRAEAKRETAGEGTAAMFLSENQLKNSTANGKVETNQIGGIGGGNFVQIMSGPYGLVKATGTTNYEGDATTGMILGMGAQTSANGQIALSVGGASAAMPEWITYGGLCMVTAAANTYTLSARFKCSAGGTLKVKNRKLWAVVLGPAA